ncbi:hypothetical protein BC939DRAFT_224192 [Gamsiella multidivaricata]|uniref:uncharacterized protein n=1 Tax=Gamsiella multidivaricata TaxID=101098 RepID=UPI00221EF52F|nr:uncharacterized protein BC939DRAFT_224192 [Gamsiella multidivaricata]KAI7831255.1 hypothetical protein BC939DRAFT_224192 [Gamsiella multidivaricata]
MLPPPPSPPATSTPPSAPAVPADVTEVKAEAIVQDTEEATLTTIADAESLVLITPQQSPPNKNRCTIASAIIPPTTQMTAAVSNVDDGEGKKDGEDGGMQDGSVNITAPSAISPAPTVSAAVARVSSLETGDSSNNITRNGGDVRSGDQATASLALVDAAPMANHGEFGEKIEQIKTKSVGPEDRLMMMIKDMAKVRDLPSQRGETESETIVYAIPSIGPEHHKPEEPSADSTTVELPTQEPSSLSLSDDTAAPTDPLTTMLLQTIQPLLVHTDSDDIVAQGSSQDSVAVSSEQGTGGSAAMDQESSDQSRIDTNAATESRPWDSDASMASGSEAEARTSDDNAMEDDESDTAGMQADMSLDVPESTLSSTGLSQDLVMNQVGTEEAEDQYMNKAQLEQLMDDREMEKADRGDLSTLVAMIEDAPVLEEAVGVDLDRKEAANVLGGLQVGSASQDYHSLSMESAFDSDNFENALVSDDRSTEPESTSTAALKTENGATLSDSVAMSDQLLETRLDIDVAKDLLDSKVLDALLGIVFIEPEHAKKTLAMDGPTEAARAEVLLTESVPAGSMSMEPILSDTTPTEIVSSEIAPAKATLVESAPTKIASAETAPVESMADKAGVKESVVLTSPAEEPALKDMTEHIQGILEPSVVDAVDSNLDTTTGMPEVEERGRKVSSESHRVNFPAEAEEIRDSSEGMSDMDVDGPQTVPDVKMNSYSSPAPTSSSTPDNGDRGGVHDRRSSLGQGHGQRRRSSTSPSVLRRNSTASRLSAADYHGHAHPSWHFVPGSDLAFLSEMAASNADLKRFRRETQWLEERVSRPKRDKETDSVLDKALGLTRDVPTRSRDRRDHGGGGGSGRSGPSLPPAVSASGVVRLSSDSRLALSMLKMKLLADIEEQTRLESDQETLQRTLDRTRTRVRERQELQEQAEEEIRAYEEKQEELERELQRVRKQEKACLEMREQQRKQAEGEVRQLQATLRMLQEQQQQRQILEEQEWEEQLKWEDLQRGVQQ